MATYKKPGTENRRYTYLIGGRYYGIQRSGWRGGWEFQQQESCGRFVYKWHYPTKRKAVEAMRKYALMK